jgi:multidrug efflux pump subunit AcrA (membrane-fusion protein)
LFRYRLRRLLPGSPLPSAPKSGLKLLGSPTHLLGIGGIAAAVLLLGTMNLKVTGDFAVLPVHNSDVRSEVDGIVSDVLVDEGDEVKKGQVLARLSSREFGADLEKTGADLEEATAHYNLLSAGTRPEQIELARKELETARARRDHAQAEIDSKSKVRSDEIEKAEERAGAVSGAADVREEQRRSLEEADGAGRAVGQGLRIGRGAARGAATRGRRRRPRISRCSTTTTWCRRAVRRRSADGGLRESEQRLRLLQAARGPRSWRPRAPRSSGWNPSGAISRIRWR